MHKTKTQIIEQIANERLVEEMIELLNSQEKQFNLEDLAQDVYLSLLEKDSKLIEKLYRKNQLRFFIQKMLTNSVYSKTSPYYKIYKKYDAITSELKNDEKNKADRHY